MRTLDPVSQLLLIDFEGGHPQIGLANQIPQRIEVFGPHFSNDHHDTRWLHNEKNRQNAIVEPIVLTGLDLSSLPRHSFARIPHFAFWQFPVTLNGLELVPLTLND